MSGAPRSVRPGELGDADRADLVELAAAARRSHDWALLADRLVRLRAWGVPVAALSAVVGVGESRLRVMCRDHGPDPAMVGDPLAGAGWVDTVTAARAVLGVSVARLLGHTVRAETGGVAVMAGWTRLWLRYVVVELKVGRLAPGDVGQLGVVRRGGRRQVAPLGGARPDCGAAAGRRAQRPARPVRAGGQLRAGRRGGLGVASRGDPGGASPAERIAGSLDTSTLPAPAGGAEQANPTPDPTTAPP